MCYSWCNECTIQDIFTNNFLNVPRVLHWSAFIILKHLAQPMNITNGAFVGHAYWQCPCAFYLCTQLAMSNSKGHQKTQMHTCRAP